MIIQESSFFVEVGAAFPSLVFRTDRVTQYIKSQACH